MTRNPYEFQVCSVEEAVVAVVNGRLVGSLSEGPVTVQLQDSIRTARIVVYAPSAEISQDHEVVLNCGGKEYRIGSLLRTGVLSGTFDVPLGTFDLRLRESKSMLTNPHQETQKILADILDIFHDGKVNPSFGALRVNSIQSAVKTSTFSQDLATLLKAEKEFCHCYKGKDNETWVVLHSHCKKVSVGYENTVPYAFLLADLVKQLGRHEMSLGDIFRWISSGKQTNSLLASNFTILKKFLIKYNAHFAWFQDDVSKTTKVVLH